MKGFQRIVNENRARQIARTVIDQERTFPNAITLASDIKKLEFADCALSLPEASKFLVVDGQHRLADGTLRRALPIELDLPKADDEVHVLLERYGFAVPKGHLDQGIAAHARGDWAAANGQFRPFMESLFDVIAERLAQGIPLPVPGAQRRIWLANRNPSFFFAELNEWDGQGKGFIEAFFRRLHPAGAHPGLSDEDDSTFRLHIVLLVARNLLRRL